MHYENGAMVHPSQWINGFPMSSMKDFTFAATIQDNNHIGFAGKVVYFKGIKDPAFANLNSKVVLISDDLRDTNLLMGYCLNERIHESLRPYMQRNGYTMPEQFNFVPVLSGAVHEFCVDDVSCPTYLMEKGKELPLPHTSTFGNFVTYMPDDIEDAGVLAEYMGARQDVLILDNVFMINRNDIIKLHGIGNAFIADANPAIVFHQSEFMRAALSFPDHFPDFQPWIKEEFSVLKR